MTDGRNNMLAANIMIVDDLPENLQVLAGMLKDQGYTVRPVPSGKLALAAAKNEPPDMILLDITMPEMDGYEVCAALKGDPELKDIPVIFISALTDTFDKVKAFQIGGVDYVTKPFQFEEVGARVRAHLELRQSRLEVQNLLSKTFVASLRTMMDILSMVNPLVFDQSNRLKRYVGMIGAYLKIDPQRIWHLEMAAMLSQIGCVTVPEDILRKKLQGEAVTTEEDRIFRDHPHVAAELIGGIPRMENIAEIIRRQQEPIDMGISGTDIHNMDMITLGSRLLRLLIDYDCLLQSGKNPVAALLALQENLRGHAPVLMGALRYVVEEEGKEEVQLVSVQELSVGMILMDHVVTEAGMLILHRSNELSPNLISLLKHYAQKHRIKEPLKVLAKKIRQ